MDARLCKVWFLWSVLLSTILFSSCKKNEAEEAPVGTGKLRIVNAVYGSDQQDFYNGNQKLSITPLGYGDYSNYFTVQSGTAQIALKNTISGKVTVSANGGIYPGTAYTIFYYANAKGEAAITALLDSSTKPADGKFNVRFIGLTSIFNNSINVNVSGGSAIVTGLAYYKYTDYFTLNANSTLEIAVNGSLTKTIIPAQEFNAGKIYTVWLDAISPTECRYHLVVQE